MGIRKSRRKTFVGSLDTTHFIFYTMHPYLVDKENYTSMYDDDGGVCVCVLVEQKKIKMSLEGWTKIGSHDVDDDDEAA